MSDDVPAAAIRPAYVALCPSLGRKVLGWFLLVLGVLGLVLPFLQGFLFLALGVFVLRDQHVWAADRWAWVSGKWPGVVSKVEDMERRTGERIARWGASVRRMIGRG